MMPLVGHHAPKSRLRRTKDGNDRSCWTKRHLRTSRVIYKSFGLDYHTKRYFGWFHRNFIQFYTTLLSIPFFINFRNHTSARHRDATRDTLTQALCASTWKRCTAPPSMQTKSTKVKTLMQTMATEEGVPRLEEHSRWEQRWRMLLHHHHHHHLITIIIIIIITTTIIINIIIIITTTTIIIIIITIITIIITIIIIIITIIITIIIIIIIIIMFVLWIQLSSLSALELGTPVGFIQDIRSKYFPTFILKPHFPNFISTSTAAQCAFIKYFLPYLLAIFFPLTWRKHTFVKIHVRRDPMELQLLSILLSVLKYPSISLPHKIINLYTDMRSLFLLDMGPIRAWIGTYFIISLTCSHNAGMEHSQ